jgi:SNF2 family DNA or RNA helicase
LVLFTILANLSITFAKIFIKQFITFFVNIENVKTTKIPKEINATLRPYQESVYQWMQVLDEISWGGCLADDMGLGKTLQTITFLQYLKKYFPSVYFFQK